LPVFTMALAALAASHALAGRDDEARRAMDHLHKLDPALRASGVGEWLPFARPEDAELFAGGLRKAGLPP
jgi:hypothetical protein